MTDIPHEKAIPAALTLDVVLYEHYLEHCQLSDPEKQELLKTLWHLICEFVYLGFGISSLQQVIPEVCGQAENGQVKTCSALDYGELSCQNCNEQGG